MKTHATEPASAHAPPSLAARATPEATIAGAGRNASRASFLASRAALGNMRLNRLVAGSGGAAAAGDGSTCAAEACASCDCPPVEAMERSRGDPLRSTERARFEPALGPLGDVRVHEDASAREAARSLRARAFTMNEHVFLGSSAPRREGAAGTRLLAHELAHVAQSRSGSPERLLSRPSDASEQSARAFASNPGRVRLAPASAAIQRDEDDAPPPGDLAPLPDRSPIGIEAPPVGADPVLFEDVFLSADRAFVRYQLERLIAERGLHETSAFVDRFRRSPTTDSAAEERNERHRRELERYGSDVSGVPLSADQMADVRHRLTHPERVGRVIDVVTDELRIQSAEAREFLDEFQGTAEQDFRAMLTRSNERMHAEARHYGISPDALHRPPELATTAFPRPRTAFDVISDRRRHLFDARERRRHARDREAFLAAAAELRQKRDRVRRLERELETRELREARGRRPTLWGILVPIPRVRTVLDTREVERARGEYSEARDRFVREFPALAMYTEDPDRLDRLTSRTGDDVNEVLTAEINERLANIERARGYLDDGSVSIWNLPDIVAGARRRLRIDRGTLRARLVEDRLRQAADERANEERVEAVLSVIGLVLSIVAIPLSGGASLALGLAATAINVGLTIEHIQDYQIESTLSGTDFSLAQSISHEEPSLFWLAVEIVGTALDVGMAVQQFRALAALRRAAIAGEREAAQLLRHEAGRLGAAGERLVRETEAAADAAAREVRTSGRAAAAGISHDAIEAERLAQRTVRSGGHDYVSLRDGRLVRCSDWCTPIRLGYADVFESYPHLAEELTALERLGASGADGAPALTARLDAVRRAGRLEQAALEAEFRALERGSPLADDLRYVRYRRFHEGLLDFDAWVSSSRGGRGGGLAHRTRVNEILERYPGSRTEATRGGRAADVFTPGGPGGRDIYHQVGDINPGRGDPIARERRAIDDLRRAVGGDVDIIFYPKDGSAPLVNPDRMPRFRATWTI